MTPTFQMRRPSFRAAQPLARGLSNRARSKPCCQRTATVGNPEAAQSGRQGPKSPSPPWRFRLSFGSPGGDEPCGLLKGLTQVCEGGPRPAGSVGTLLVGWVESVMQQVDWSRFPGCRKRRPVEGLPTALLGLVLFGLRWGLATGLLGGDQTGPRPRSRSGLPCAGLLPWEQTGGRTGENSFTFWPRAEESHPSHQRLTGPSARGGLWPSICGVAGLAARRPGSYIWKTCVSCPADTCWETLSDRPATAGSPVPPLFASSL
ncbi:hypothetical protein HJG60_009980 [Phyllostomus discolor]|uniref:Uncharacterized protein n=1 Tax=Phyllostomus discolor TaxID=89673 RepID=A0A834B8P7_9CHIR|nr:hypothetical protein HJG60_009980 [Phyllostomus discolor]